MARGKGGITKYIVWAILIASFVGFYRLLCGNRSGF